LRSTPLPDGTMQLHLAQAHLTPAASGAAGGGVLEDGG
jgi:hypothetical protein